MGKRDKERRKLKQGVAISRLLLWANGTESYWGSLGDCVDALDTPWSISEA